MRDITKILLTGLVSGALLSRATAQNGSKTYSCDFEQTTISNGRSDVETGKVWIKGSRRIRMEEHNRGLVITHIVNDSDAWIFDSASKTGYHSRKPSASFEMQDTMRRDVVEGPAAWLRAGGMKTGSQVLDGVKCDVYRRREKGGPIATLWALPGSDHFPRQIQATGAVSFGGAQTPLNVTIRFKHWQAGKPIDDALFRPPAEYKIREVPAGPGDATQPHSGHP